MPRRLSALLTAAIVLIFMALTGFTPSVTRAGVMCLVLLAGQMVRREADSLNSLGLSLLLILAANPFAVMDVDVYKRQPPTVLSLEQSLEFINDDELVEVTPKSIRLRKRTLSKEQRMKEMARKKN